jgi:hypothetical protein
VQGEADDQQPGQGQFAAGGGLADGQALGEVVQADPGGDAHPGAQRRCLGRGLGEVGLGRGHGPRAEANRPWPGAPGPQPPEVEQGEQADTEADRVDEPEGGELAPAGFAFGRLLHGVLDRFGGMGQDLEQQEHQNAGRGGVQERPGFEAGHPDPAQG